MWLIALMMHKIGLKKTKQFQVFLNMLLALLSHLCAGTCVRAERTVNNDNKLLVNTNGPDQAH